MTTRFSKFVFAFSALVLSALSAAAQPVNAPAVVSLIGDDPNAFIRFLNNDGGNDGREIRVELRDVYAGVSCVYVAPFQRHSARIPGWNYPILEKPGPGEYRYIRFAWKRDGGDGIMVQLHSNGLWNHRYYAGERSQQTSTWGPMMQVDPKAPREWTVVTRDLFKDWGNMHLTGFAFTPMENGVGGYFGPIYLSRTIEDLDRASADAFGKTALKDALTQKELDALWDDLAKADLKAADAATRKLTAGRKESVAFLAAKAKAKDAGINMKEVASWIADLDSEDFGVREDAYRSLSKLGDRAISPLQQARMNPRSGEQKNRIESLLKDRGAINGGLTGDRVRLVRAARVLEWSGTAEALSALEVFEKMPDAAALPEIKHARERLAKTVKR
jgi:hypothetical protein